MTVVVDASVVVNLLIDRPVPPDVMRLLDDRALLAPGHLDAEVLSALARQHRGGNLTDDEVQVALDRLGSMPVERVPINHAMARIAWALRDNIAMNDGLYIALLKIVGAELATLDRRLVRAVDQLNLG